MAKYKYEECPHKWGSFQRGDSVAAFVPMANGKREVVPAEVIGINKKSVRVCYSDNGDVWETTVPMRYVCLIQFSRDIMIPETYFNDLYKGNEKWQKLEAAGVDNWEGYDDAMAEE